MLKSYIIGATAALALTASVASAATITVGGTAAASPNENDFSSGGLIGHIFISDLTQLLINGDSVVTFTEVGAESGYNNTFTASGTTISENGNFGIPNFSDGEAFSKSYLNATNLLNEVSFGSDLGTDAVPGDAGGGFAVYALGDSGDYSDTFSGSFSTLFFAFDDNNQTDDNHDDYMIRVDIAAVPLPAGVVLLLSALFGAGALRRRQKSA